MRTPLIGTLRATEPSDLPALAKFHLRAYKFEPSDFLAPHSCGVANLIDA
jgi:hypothetical protein